jgi:hypothetical protein
MKLRETRIHNLYVILHIILGHSFLATVANYFTIFNEFRKPLLIYKHSEIYIVKEIIKMIFIYLNCK